MFLLQLPGQAPFDGGGLYLARHDAFQQVVEPRIGIEAIQLGGGQQGSQDGPRLGSAINPCKEAVDAPKSNASHRALDRVGIDLKPAILEEEGYTKIIAQCVRTIDLVEKLLRARRGLALESAIDKLDKYDLIALDDISAKPIDT